MSLPGALYVADPLAEVSMVFGPDSRDKTLRVEYLVQQLQNGGYDHESGLLPSCYPLLDC